MGLNDLDNHDGVFTYLETDILEYEVKWSLRKCISSQVMSNSLQTMDCSPPGLSVRKILQKRILEWVATPHSEGSS